MSGETEREREEKSRVRSLTRDEVLIEVARIKETIAKAGWKKTPGVEEVVTENGTMVRTALEEYKLLKGLRADVMYDKPSRLIPVYTTNMNHDRLSVEGEQNLSNLVNNLGVDFSGSSAYTERQVG